MVQNAEFDERNLGLGELSVDSRAVAIDRLATLLLGFDSLPDFEQGVLEPLRFKSKAAHGKPKL